MIDVYSVITNGIISSENTIIIDPLGYYVIYIEEEINEIPFYYGGGYSGGLKTKKTKKIKIKVKFNDENINDFYNEIIIDNFNLVIKNVELNDKLNEVKVFLQNPLLLEQKKNIILKIKM